MKTFTLTGFATFLATLEAEVKHANHSALEKAAVIVETEAKRVLGTYDYGWTPLAASTIASKATGDSPLLETGEMRDSIEHTVTHDEAQIGSNNDKALWQELGTSKIPPRPFLQGALQHKADEVVAVIGREIHGALIGERVVGENVLLRKP
jgi:HK97 gp10 family phage protein